MEDLVSVVVPVYNSESWLDRCIRSITAQTYPHLEILLVDDGSRDGSGAICDRWADRDSRIRVIHQANAGAGAARNRGMAQARGSWLLFFDSDDYAHVTLVEKTLARAAETGAQVVLFGSHWCREDGSVLTGRIPAGPMEYRGDRVQRELLPDLFSRRHGLGISPWGKLYAASVLHGVTFPEDRSAVCEDAWFQLRLFSGISFAVVLPECLYYYCRRPTSLSRQVLPDRQLRNDAFLRDLEGYVRRQDLPEELLDHIRARYHGLTLGTMMSLIRSDRPFREKRQLLAEAYRNPVLAETLTDNVLALDAALPQLFWRCLGKKRYGLCTALLAANAARQRLGEGR